jgi:hypothetical protein
MDIRNLQAIGAGRWHCEHAWHLQGRRDLNPRPSVLETDALPTELLPSMRCRLSDAATVTRWEGYLTSRRSTVLIEPLHDHVPHNQLEIFRNLHIVNCEVDWMLRECLALSAVVTQDCEG